MAHLVELDGPVEFQTQRVQSAVHNAQQGAVVDREIAAEADDKAALTHADREVCTAEVMGDLIDIERQEASAVWLAQSQGLPVEHRSDISPLALLGVRLITAPRATNGPSSPEHAYDLVGR